jgi:hypothetical protein
VSEDAFAASESGLATSAASLEGFAQPARKAPADAASTVRPKLRLVNRVGSWFSEFEFDVLQDVHPLETQLPQSISFLPDDSGIFFIMILIKIYGKYWDYFFCPVKAAGSINFLI